MVGGISSLVFLFSLCFATAIEALQTVFHTGHGHLDTMHHPDYILVVTGANLGLWIVSFLTVGGFSYHQTSAVRQRRGSQHPGARNPAKKRKEEKEKSCTTYYSATRVSDVLRDLQGCFFTFLTSSLVHFNVSTTYSLQISERRDRVTGAETSSERRDREQGDRCRDILHIH